ncbi:DUF6292 family protein [Streptomyces sp. NPDC002817]|uniref:DUF6292 family protein n=1 Tax=Streptomyces sp. NPDC088357 TaxID=3154655 RepID=UPI00343615E5
MLLEPPGSLGSPQGLPHWPYVRAVDDALTARGIPPGSVRADATTPERGFTTYMWLTWDMSRTHGQRGIRLHWKERLGWFYALTGINSKDVLHYTVAPFRTVFPRPQDIAEVAEHLVCFRQFPDVEYRTEWDGADDVRAAGRDFRRLVLGLAPLGHQDAATGAGPGTGGGEGVQLTVDTRADTYEEAIAAVQAAYGRSPDVLAGRLLPDLPQTTGSPRRR